MLLRLGFSTLKVAAEFNGTCGGRRQILESYVGRQPLIPPVQGFMLQYFDIHDIVPFKHTLDHTHSFTNRKVSSHNTRIV